MGIQQVFFLNYQISNIFYVPERNMQYPYTFFEHKDITFMQLYQYCSTCRAFFSLFKLNFILNM